MKRILGISGSLRAGSSNERLIKAISSLHGLNLEISLCDKIGALPHFNPDYDHEQPPGIVKVFRNEVASADGILISSPEYAHGIPGSLKNALDWLVSFPEFEGKAILLVCGGEFVPDQLEEILRTMSAKVLMNYRISGPALRKAFTENSAFPDQDLMSAVLEGLRKV